MTRNEAIKKVLATESRHLKFDDMSVEYLVDALETLGVLMFDEPKSISNRFTDVYLREGCANGTSSEQFQAALFDAGLMLVEVKK